MSPFKKSLLQKTQVRNFTIYILRGMLTNLRTISNRLDILISPEHTLDIKASIVVINRGLNNIISTIKEDWDNVKNQS